MQGWEGLTDSPTLAGYGSWDRRGVLSAVVRIPGLTAAAARDLGPALAAGPLVRRRALGRARRGRRGLVGGICPQPWVTADGRRVRLDELLGDSFSVLTAAPPSPSPSLRAVADGLGARTDYAALHRWSVTDLEGFRGAVWEYFDIEADSAYPRWPPAP